MIGLIIKTLNTIPVIPAQTIEDYRRYLAVNYPQLTLGDMEQVLNQLINQTLDNYLTEFTVEYRQQLKEFLLEGVLSLQPFAIFASDVLKAGLKLAHRSPEFYKEIASWTGQFEFPGLNRETVVNYILQHNELSTQPDSSRYLTPAQENAPTQAVLSDDSPTVLYSAVDTFQPELAEETEDCPKPLELTVGFKNPYCTIEETRVSQPIPVEPRDFYLKLVTRFETVEKTMRLYFRKNWGKYRKSAIAVLLVMLTLGACLWLFNNRTRAKENLAQPGQPQLATKSKMSLSMTKQQAAALRVPQQSQQPVAEVSQSPSKLDYNRPVPIPAAPNTIVVGHIKMKTPKGMEEVPVRRYFERKLRIKATAYDLSIASCGKDMSHPEYGITRTGTRAKRGRTIAVDPRIIPLGRKVYIKFPKKYRHMNGIYVAEDTGSKIKGYRIDIFLGEDLDGNAAVRREARRFGRRKVEVFLLQE